MMNKTKLLLVLFLWASPVFADSWWTVYLNPDGTVKGTGLTENTKPAHPLQENEYPKDYSFPTIDFKFWKKVGADWVAMTPAEQQAVVDAENTTEANYDNWSKREKAMMRLMVKEINLLRVALGLAPRTEAQIKTALKAEM